ncbi:MAG: hypothetical protein IKX66_05575 [Clostridia bacterium]|nr:hypothetical protein [Clostridia bacterium]
MKKTVLALILCLVLCVFAFASCQKKADAEATQGTTAAVTTAAATTGETLPITSTEPQHVHIPEDHYTVDREPTCSDPGEQAYYCDECGEKIADSVVAIPIDPEAHVVSEWENVQMASILGDGTDRGVCTLCGREVTRKVEAKPVYEWKYTTSSTTQQQKTQSVRALLGEGEHYYYNDDTGAEGLDLIIEFSFLYNPTLKNLADKNSASGGHPVLTGSMYDADVYWVALKDGASGCRSPFAGGFEQCATLKTVEYGPDGMGSPTSGAGTEYGDYPNIGGSDRYNPEYGWHRLAFVYHQELLNADALMADTSANATAAQYLVTSTGYLDGEKIFKISNRTSENFEASADFTVNGYLFVAKSDGNGGIVYTDSPNNKNATWVKIPSKCTSTGTAYAVIADYYVTAGTDVVMQVERNDTPASNVYVTSDGTEISAPVWYNLKTD